MTLDSSTPLPVFVSLTFLAVFRSNPTLAARRTALDSLALAARNPKKFLAAEELDPAFTGCFFGVAVAGFVPGIFGTAASSLCLCPATFFSPDAAIASCWAIRASLSRSLNAATVAPWASSSFSRGGMSFLRPPSRLSESSNLTSLSISGSNLTFSAGALGLPWSKPPPAPPPWSFTYVSPSARSVATCAPNASFSSALSMSADDTGLDSACFPSPADSSHSPYGMTSDTTTSVPPPAPLRALGARPSTNRWTNDTFAWFR
mmetsp:Transcript_28226/g.67947  ORF Transcript_28226/g.67947 Transcript_28226/m.67947 type:complete len:261 (+) Transcript_28226:217-999(+)